MPTSKKRVINEKKHVEVAVKNPVKTTLGKVVIITLSGGFVLSVLAGLIAVIVQVAQR